MLYCFGVRDGGGVISGGGYGEGGVSGSLDLMRVVGISHPPLANQIKSKRRRGWYCVCLDGGVIRLGTQTVGSNACIRT